MRTMLRNRQKFYEASLLSTTMGKDGDGNYTENISTYTKPRKREAVITSASGQTDLQLFGANEVYDKIITLNKGEDYLAVGSVLWVDTLAILDENGDTQTPYDYVVTKVAYPLDSVLVAIRKVEVS